MTVEQFYIYLKDMNITLWVENDLLRYRVPKGKLTDDMKNKIKEKKKELLIYLEGLSKKNSDHSFQVNFKSKFTNNLMQNNGVFVNLNENQNIKLVDKKLVHKYKEENVLVYSLRRILPRRINAKIVEDIIMPELEQPDKDFFFKYYSIEKESVHQEKEKYYVLNSIPQKVSIKTVKEYIKNTHINPDNMRKLRKYYYRDKKANLYILKEDFTDQDELQIIKILQQKKLYITDYDKAKLSDLIEKYTVVEKKDLFYANMYVNPEHSFFFEHPLEHVPGLMIIEATRQLLSACSHKYYNVPFKNVNFIFDNIRVDFVKFLELNYPITICVKPENIETKPGYFLTGDFIVTVFQKNCLAANLNYTGSIVEADIFNIIRNEEKEKSTNPRFYLRSGFTYEIFLRDTKNKKYPCSLLDLSVTGFRLAFLEKYDSINENKFEFILYFEKIGFIQGLCQNIWYNKKDNNAGFKILSINETDLNNLKEGIKRICYVKEEREGTYI